MWIHAWFASKPVVPVELPSHAACIVLGRGGLDSAVLHMLETPTMLPGRTVLAPASVAVLARLSILTAGGHARFLRSGMGLLLGSCP